MHERACNCLQNTGTLVPTRTSRHWTPMSTTIWGPDLRSNLAESCTRPFTTELHSFSMLCSRSCWWCFYRSRCPFQGASGLCLQRSAESGCQCLAGVHPRRGEAARNQGVRAQGELLTSLLLLLLLLLLSLFSLQLLSLLRRVCRRKVCWHNVTFGLTTEACGYDSIERVFRKPNPSWRYW